MANIREYIQMRRESEKQEEYRNEIRVHRKKRRKAVLLFVFVLAVLGISAFVYLKNRTFHTYDVISEQKREDSELTCYRDYQGNILKYNMDGISCIDKNFKMLWNQAYEMQSPMVEVCEEYVAVCDSGGNKVYILNTDGLQGEVETKFPVKKISVAGQGTVAVLMEEEDVNYIVYYDKKGKIIAENKAPVEKQGFILDFCLSHDGYKLAASYMMIENASIKTNLAFYNFNSVGENEIDHLVSGSTYSNEIIPNVEFLSDNLAVVFGNDFFEIFEGSQKPVSISRQEFESEIKSVFYNEKYIGFIFKSDEPEYPYEMKVYNTKGRKVFEQSFGFEYDYVQIYGDRIYINNEAGCQILKLKGKKIYDDSLNGILKTVIPLSEDKIMAVFDDRLAYIQLK